MYKLHPCMCIWIQPVMVYHYPGPCICIGRLLFVLLWGFFFLIVLYSSDVYRIIQSISVIFNYGVSETCSNAYHGDCKSDIWYLWFLSFSITKEMQHKWSVAALLCKITVNWVCSGKCILTVDCKLKNTEKYKINRMYNGSCRYMIELFKT